jgi:O-antigen ligase
MNFTKLNFPLLLFLLYIFFNVLFSEYLSDGFKKLERMLIIPVSILILPSFSKIKMRSFGFILIFSTLAATLYSHTIVIIKFISNNEQTYKAFFNLNYSYKSLGNTINLHPTYYSLYILTAIILIFYYLREKSNFIFLKILMLISLIYLSFFLIQLSSRISIAALYLIIMFNIIYYIIQKKAYLKGVLLIISFHLLSFLLIMNIGVTKYRFQHLLGFTYYTGYTVNDGNHKIDLWSAAINANENFLFGNGMANIQNSLNKEYLKRGLKKELRENYNSHNQYIQYYVGLGVIGLLLFIFILFYYGRLFIKTKNILGFQYVLVVSLISFTECLWDRHNGLVFIIFTLLLFIKSSYEEEVLLTKGESMLLKTKADKITNSNKNLV